MNLRDKVPKINQAYIQLKPNLIESEVRKLDFQNLTNNILEELNKFDDFVKMQYFSELIPFTIPDPSLYLETP